MHACGLARTTVALAYIITGQANGGLLMHSTWQRMRRPHATPSLTSACFFMRWASVPAATRLMVHAHHVNNNHAAGHDAAVAGASMFQMAASPFLQAVLPLATPPPPPTPTWHHLGNLLADTWALLAAHQASVGAHACTAQPTTCMLAWPAHNLKQAQLASSAAMESQPPNCMAVPTHRGWMWGTWSPSPHPPRARECPASAEPRREKAALRQQPHSQQNTPHASSNSQPQHPPLLQQQRPPSPHTPPRAGPGCAPPRRG